MDRSKKIIPEFQNPASLRNHVEGFKESVPTVTHTSLLHRLKQEIKPIDFQKEAFPEIGAIKERLKDEDPELLEKRLKRFKLKAKHYRILTVRKLLETAEKNNWGLCKNHSFIYLYNGEYWADLEKETFAKFMGETAEKMGVAWDNAQDYKFREDLFKQFLSTAYLPTPEVDPNTVLINLMNGTFEITSKGTKLRPFAASDFLTYQLPFDYNPEAKAPIFEDYLNTVLPDKDRQKILAEYIGFLFIKNGSNSLKEEKALILYGSGANGKSVFFEIINALLGEENTSTYSLQSLTEEKGYHRAKLANKLVNYASEINGKLETSLFKQLVSGEPVEARLPYGQPFILKQYARLIFNSNELPKEVEQTNAYFRRFLIIPFDVTIPEENQDKNLHSKIIENELSGVFNWVLEGLHRLLRQGKFTHCEAVIKAVEQYKLQSDSVRLFLDEVGYKKDLETYKPLKELYAEYRNFCIDGGFRPVNKMNFSKRLEGLKIEIVRRNVGKVVFVSTNSEIPF